jgi:hypothetical protein
MTAVKIANEVKRQLTAHIQKGGILVGRGSLYFCRLDKALPNDRFYGAYFWRERGVIGKRIRLTYDLVAGWRALCEFAGTSEDRFSPSVENFQFRVRPTFGDSDQWWTIWPSSEAKLISSEICRSLDREMEWFSRSTMDPASLSRLIMEDGVRFELPYKSSEVIAKLDRVVI